MRDTGGRTWVSVICPHCAMAKRVQEDQHATWLEKHLKRCSMLREQRSWAKGKR